MAASAPNRIAAAPHEPDGQLNNDHFRRSEYKSMYPLSAHVNDGKSNYGGRVDGRGGGLRDVVGYANKPPAVNWPREAKVAVNLVLNYEEGGENCLLHGDGESEKLLSEIVGAGALGRLLCFIQ
jgi:hypothetical protein